MNKLFTVLSLSISLFCIGCASDPSGSNVRVQAELARSTVQSTQEKSHKTAGGATVESMQITSIRLLVDEIKLQSKNSTSDTKVKTGPGVLSVDASGPRLYVTSTIPSGTYDKVHIKFHRLSDGERAALAGNAEFADFIANERYSVIIQGTVVSGGQTFPFTFGGKAEETLKLDLAEVSIDADGEQVIAVQIDPVLIFKDTGVILDPRDPANADAIEKAVKKGIKAIRK